MCCRNILTTEKGNAWAAAGMLRVEETLRHSKRASELLKERADLMAWIQEILNSTSTHQVRRTYPCFIAGFNMSLRFLSNQAVLY